MAEVSSDEKLIKNIFNKGKNKELFFHSSESLLKSTTEYAQHFAPKETRRRDRFLLALKKYERMGNFPEKNWKKFGRKGFPDQYRSEIYSNLLQLDEIESKFGSDFFQNLLKTEIPSSIGRVIQADIPRTLGTFTSTMTSTTTKTSLMKMLRDVLWAFAVYRPDIGYCQSMNFLAAYFISIFGSAKKSFFALVQLIDSPTSPSTGLHIPGYYAPGMDQLITDIGVLELLLRRRLGEKKCKTFFEDRGITSLTMIVSEWFLSLFITILPIRVVNRVFDFIISNSNGNNKIIFRISFILLKYLINNKNFPDFDSIMQGHKKFTKSFVSHNRLIKESIIGLRNFSIKELLKYREEFERKNPNRHRISNHPIGNTMMRLEEAIAQQTQTTLTVPEDAILQ
jgi:hypothetical protein